MADVDLLAALISYLAAQADVSGLVAARIYGQELPAAQATYMPRKALVLRYAGREPYFGQNSWVRHSAIRLDVWHYGETFYQADRLRRTVHEILKGLIPIVQGNCKIHALTDLAGPIAVLDPETGWPFIVDTYRVFFAEQVVS